MQYYCPKCRNSAFFFRFRNKKDNDEEWFYCTWSHTREPVDCLKIDYGYWDHIDDRIKEYKNEN